MVTLSGSFNQKVFATSCEDPKAHMIPQGQGNLGPVIICANSVNPAAAGAKKDLDDDATTFAKTSMIRVYTAIL